MIRRADDKTPTFLERLEEADRFFMGTGKVPQTVRSLAADLDREGIDYAIIGGMALNAHGYRRETVDVDVLVRPDGLDAFRDRLVGRGYIEKFAGARKSFKNTQTGVTIEFLTTGEYPGDGKPKPVAFPDPASVGTVMDGVRVVDLLTLINLKLASGMTASHRRRDLADVQELIRRGIGDQIISEHLSPYVKDIFMTLRKETIKRFRIQSGTQLEAVPHFPYYLCLMAGLESLKATIRWDERIRQDESKVWGRDRLHAIIAGAGACSLVIRCVKDGIKKNVLNAELIEEVPGLQSVWDRINSSKPEDLIGRAHRIRDKYFGHWDEEVMRTFVQAQASRSEMDAFIESDADGAFLNTRYLWPGAAFIVDLLDTHEKEVYDEKEKRFLADLVKLWGQTAILVSQIIKAWLERTVAAGHLKFIPVETGEEQS